MKLTFRFKGGQGSGFFGHAGRPGKVGGSMAADKGGGGISTGGDADDVAMKINELRDMSRNRSIPADMRRWAKAELRNLESNSSVVKPASDAPKAISGYGPGPSKKVAKFEASAARGAEGVRQRAAGYVTTISNVPATIKNAAMPFKNIRAGNRGQWSVHSDTVKFNASGAKLAAFLKAHMDAGDLAFDDKTTAEIFLDAYNEHGTSEFEIESHTLQKYQDAANLGAAIAHGKYMRGKGYDRYEFMKFMDTRRDEENAKYLDRMFRRG